MLQVKEVMLGGRLHLAAVRDWRSTSARSAWCMLDALFTISELNVSQIKRSAMSQLVQD